MNNKKDKVNKDIINDLMTEYPGMRFLTYDELDDTFPNSIYFDELPSRETTGVLKTSQYVNGRLLQTYSEKENHVGVIASTRLGKTTSYVIPTVISFARAKNKRSMVVSDPKGEIYGLTSEMLREEGYTVLLLNFRDALHSECWNPLTPIFRKYRSSRAVMDEVEVVSTPNGPRNSFHGVVYESQKELDAALERWKRLLIEDVGNDIDEIGMMVCPTVNTRDPYWEDSGRELLKAYLWGLLEDSDEGVEKYGREQVTEDTFSFATILEVMAELNKSDGAPQFFSRRPADSRARKLAENTIPHAPTTRSCVATIFSSKLSVFRDVAMRLVTGCNSFDMSILTGDEPVAIFIDYRDELKVHFRIISLFVQDAYRLLIEHANAQSDGKRKIPFYFVLDEFGNFPEMKDFETTISACAGRNIFFILIMQSYAQLANVYGEAVASIVIENLNMHVFMGSNEPTTLDHFSKECGTRTRISPVSALRGTGYGFEHIDIEEVPLVPVSRLSRFEPGECVITEANCGYVLFSKLERYYLCKEFQGLKRQDDKAYVGHADPLDAKYVYGTKRRTL